MEGVIVSALPPDMSDEDRAAVALALPLVDPENLADLIGDAMLAQQLLTEGKRDEAIAVIERYRPLAEDAGMGGMLDSILAGL